jgi:sialate O-acetylesterase
MQKGLSMKLRVSGRFTVLVAAFVLTIASVWSAGKGLTLPSIISDHMVIQQGVALPIWGTDVAGTKITVAFAGQKKKTVADKDGKWMVKLRSVKVKKNQKSQEMTITGSETIVIKDVLIGENWICSGQSNMQMAVGSSLNAREEIAVANYPEIRLFSVPNVTSLYPQTECKGSWVLCSPETVGGFSAVGYFFGRHLYKSLNRPIGLINSSWGGTIAEAWTSAEALRANLPEFIPELDQVAKPTGQYLSELEAYKAKKVDMDAAMEKFYALQEDVKTAGKTAVTDFDDSSWKTMKLPGNWELNGLPDLDGIVWFRKTLDIPASWAGKDIILHPGPIDEVETTWFNGTVVGSRGNSRKGDTQYWNQLRDYRVNGNLVKAGKNVVAIRVSDCVGQGGLWGASADVMFAELADGTDKTKISLAGAWRYSVEYTLPRPPANPATPNRPSVIFNAMINPLIPFAIGGAIWYQGESNAGRGKQYQTLLPTMITDWRTRWGIKDFPFLIVSLANFMGRDAQPAESTWAEIREAQTMTTTKLKKVGQGLAIDIGDEKDIHPKNKQEVGRRLGLAAEAIAYKLKVSFSGPVFDTMKVAGNKAELTFKYTDNGLKVKGDALKGFAICGENKKFVWAQAKIEGDKVIVWAEGVAKPIAVRYAWGNNPECNLYNGADLPTVPFRTDVAK